VRLRLSAAQVAELAALLEDEPRRVGAVDAVLHAAAERRGMTLMLTDRRRGRSWPGGLAAQHVTPSIAPGRQQ
jgi:hypothetical protein